MPALILKPGREKSLLRRHPWIFSGGIQHVDGAPVSGGTVDLLSSDRQFLARGSYSPNSQIRARVWSFEEEPIDKEFFRQRIRSSLSARRTLEIEKHSNAARWIYAESDRIPGLIVDRYGDVLVLQSLTAGSEFWKETLADLLLEETRLSTIYERSDSDVRELEGLATKVENLRGELSSLAFPITEHDLKFNVNLQSGHKTGSYLDQRENRLRVRELAKDKEVLDCFCYTGGFTVNALAGGAKAVLSIDSSAEALELLRENIGLNQLDATRHTALEGDVFQLLRKFRDENRSFDMIILDPPKFAPTAAQAERAARGYKDINLFAFKLLRAGGTLVTFSCSGGIDAGLFQKIVAGS
ncbi:MAG TPA: class I SAM-dependent methyltransferase, partial [Anaerolineales bacterium]|nr:class I SAM-dependent methyltransferase [Anaerolineales bacterium]